ncbi:MAG: hypothetical protein ACE5GX_06390 [Thermoanaerobaculia bacterium]
MKSNKSLFCLGFALSAVLATSAAAHEITATSVACLPNEVNTALIASVDPEIDGSEQMRLYFRRLNQTGAFYWVGMNSKGDGKYWTVFPKPEDREQQELSDEWYEILKDRDWMEGHDRDWLEDWLEEQTHEAAEYYLAVTDVQGHELSRTKTLLTRVLDRGECSGALDAFETGQSRNLTVGETTEIQAGREVFHWLCDGIVSRVDADGVLRGDEVCRACVVAGWLPIATAAGAIVAGTTIETREPRRASDIQP